MLETLSLIDITLYFNICIAHTIFTFLSTPTK